MPIWVAIGIYIFGVIIASIVFGAYLKPRDDFDKLDFALFTFMALIWPILLGLALVVAIAVGLFLAIIVKPIQFLMYFGQDLNNYFVEMCERRRKRKEREHDKLVHDAKPGSGHYFDYVCD